FRDCLREPTSGVQDHRSEARRFCGTQRKRGPEKAGPEKAGLGCRYLQQRAFADELPDGIANVLLDGVLSVGVLLLQECDDVRHRARAIAQLPDQGCAVVEMDGLVRTDPIEEALSIELLDEEAEALLQKNVG